MTLLLDTHTALWFWWDDPQLSTTARALICDPANRKLVSPASAWEVAIKVSLRKLNIGGPYRGFFPQQMLRTNFEWLLGTDDHFAALSALPFHHKDPFDRLLIAQTIVENAVLVTNDPLITKYPVSVIF